ncbi:hypothetical protein BDW02DRAFT_567475 [Decorospora gaudefroyi]|uniref:P-loop containing nucleoside triphosphate hydrolase protein n=1 Tax=Decorospora gaudefroyi TaxID=184978 RepID=A0A6A5KIT9_9PLEO|nr:hypothetical protein BDW02DRAFT_567475 [Decorospora gaudefroyi]
MNSNPKPTPTPLLIFILGPHCAGKTTLGTHLSTLYTLTHIALGRELRNLVSAQPSGPAARIASKLAPAVLLELREYVGAGTLAPSSPTPMYVKERVFPEDVGGDVRVLVDGFPRGVDRWTRFRECIGEEGWLPGRMWVVVMGVDREVGYQRFLERGREGDVF